jgi:hypothetical protein
MLYLHIFKVYNAYPTKLFSPYNILCTGAFLYAPYSLLLISNKLWMGGRVGSQCGEEARGLSFEGKNKRGGGGE